MKGSHQGLAAFETRVGEAARTLLRNQGYDGGWGLTLTSVSSIVNTSEVLPILRAAGVAGKPVRQALDFLTVAIQEHSQPRHKGGRGEHTRFIAFGLAGLLSHPRFFHHDGVADAAAWCVGWLDDHQVDHGWPEVLGLDDTSLHQTALVVQNLAQLRNVLLEFGPGLVLPGKVETGSLLERVEPLIEHGVRGLLYHRRTSGAWGWRTYVDTDPSPSKTALCLLALSAVGAGRPHGEPTYPDSLREIGGVHGPVQSKRLSEVVSEAGQWLLRNHQRWETFVEDDKDVQGTAWEHMAYALCARAALRAGAGPRDPRLARAWTLMNDLWDPEARLWNEPGASGRRATIRAAYYTVAAYQEAVRRLARMSVEDIGSENAVQVPIELVVGHVALGPGRTILASTHDAEGRVACEVSGRLFDLVKVVHDAPGGRLSTEQIAQTLYVAPSSVPKYVQRVNQAVSTALGGARARLLLATTVDGVGGYRLAGR